MPHVCDPESCGLVYDPECPQWRLAGSPAGAAAAVLDRLEWARRDRACRRALRLMREDPELAEALVWLAQGELAELVREALAPLLASAARDALAEQLPDALAEQLPDALAVLTRRGDA